MDFWADLVKVVISNGIFATLFVFLFFYQLKDSSKREEEYQKTIFTLSQHLELIEDVKEEVSELKKYVEDIHNERKI